MRNIFLTDTRIEEIEIAIYNNIVSYQEPAKQTACVDLEVKFSYQIELKTALLLRTEKGFSDREDQPPLWLY